MKAVAAGYALTYVTTLKLQLAERSVSLHSRCLAMAVSLAALVCEALCHNTICKLIIYRPFLEAFRQWLRFYYVKCKPRSVIQNVDVQDG
jgi:hypothetical protein